MHARTLMVFVIGVVVGGGIIGVWAAAESRGTTRSCAWPADLDAVTAAPANHKVLLENHRVRVLDVTVSPGEKQAVHAHCWPSVMYQMYVGVAKDYDAEGQLVDEQTTPPPAAQFPNTVWLEPTPPHALHNLDTRPARLLRIELKE